MDTSHYIDLPLNSDHSRQLFDCGKQSLNHYFHSRVTEETKRGLAQCYVLVHENQPQHVCGYYTLSTHSIDVLHAPNKLGNIGYSAIPAILIGRLAAHHPSSNQGVGTVLLNNALMRCVEVSHKVGTRAVVVEALDTDAEAWYLRKGFLPLKVERKLYLMIKDIEAAFK